MFIMQNNFIINIILQFRIPGLMRNTRSGFSFFYAFIETRKNIYNPCDAIDSIVVEKFSYFNNANNVLNMQSG